MQYLDKLGWPVERIKGRWFLNFIRLLIHTRKIKTGSFTIKAIKADSENDTDSEIKELLLMDDPIVSKHHF